jgi:hypothetical protein
MLDESVYRAHRQLELAETLATKMGLPDHCVSCTSAIYGLTRSRLGLFNGVYGAICDVCYGRMKEGK